MYKENRGEGDMNDIDQIQPGLEEIPEVQHKEEIPEVIRKGSYESIFKDSSEIGGEIRRKDDEGHTLN